MLKTLVKKTKFWHSYREYIQIPLLLRFLNWFVQKVVYRTPELDFSVHFASRVTHADKLNLSVTAQRSLARKSGCYINGNNGVEIGQGTLIAAGVKIISANHRFNDFGEFEKTTPVRIGKDCWLAVNSVILPGVELGDNVVVGAGAVVTKSFPSNCVVAGVPAKIIRIAEQPEIEKDQ